MRYRWALAALMAAISISASASDSGANMKLGYTILYVRDVGASVAFYERAFGLARRFVHPEGTYAEMETGDTALAFVAHEQAGANLPGGFAPLSPDGPPVGMEIALVTPDVEGAHARALREGAADVAPPKTKPWGQVVAYVRDPDGTLVELASPMGEADSRPSHILTILAVSDLKAAADFYRQAFGWEPRIEVPVYVEFALPDGRGLGVYQREGFAHNTNRAPIEVPAGAISGTEIYLHCVDLDAAIERVRGAGARLLSERAPRDWGDEAAYFADPDGNVLVLARPLPAPSSD